MLEDEDLDTGVREILLFYQGKIGEIDLGSDKTVVFDTRPPEPPVLRQTECGPHFFRLEWSKSSPDVVKFAIERLESGIFVSLPPGPVATPGVTVRERPEGRVRVVAYDKAGNYSTSNEIELRCGSLRITSMKILAPEKDTGHINDRVVTGSDPLNYAYAIEVTTNRECSLLLVNVDAKGYGYRLFPTPCKTGRGFDSRILSSVPKRYPNNSADGIFYIGLDEVTGLEDIYAVVCEEKVQEIKAQIWRWVLNEFCGDQRFGHSIVVPKGSQQLPGNQATGGKKRTIDFDRKLAELTERYRGKVAWQKVSFWHR